MPHKPYMHYIVCRYESILPIYKDSMFQLKIQLGYHKYVYFRLYATIIKDEKNIQPWNERYFQCEHNAKNPLRIEALSGKI